MYNMCARNVGTHCWGKNKDGEGQRRCDSRGGDPLPTFQEGSEKNETHAHASKFPLADVFYVGEIEATY